MAENGGSRELRKDWRLFLTKNPDARLIVQGAMSRMRLSEDEVLLFLLTAWAAQNMMQEQQGEFQGSINRVAPN